MWHFVLLPPRFGDPQDGRGYAAISDSSPFWGPQDGRGYGATIASLRTKAFSSDPAAGTTPHPKMG